MDLDEIWYKSRPTQRALTHRISSWSKEKWQRYGTWAISQGRRGPSNGVSKMNLFMAGGHSFWLRKLIFGYVVAQCIYPKSYYYPLLIKSLVWSPQGSKDDHFGPKYRDRLYAGLVLTRLWMSLVFLDMWMTSCWENILARWVSSRQVPQSAWPERQ